LTVPALVRLPVGVVVGRRKADSPWLDYVWRPISVLVGEMEAAPWTALGEDGGQSLFYAGNVEIELHRTATLGYRVNLATGTPLLWVVLRPTGEEPPYSVLTVTADAAEGESLTEVGSDLVETVPMPEPIRRQVESFVAEHHIERPFVKRQRDRGGSLRLADPADWEKDGK
jgi:hypothetical protein